jgi:hypothetical protein
VLPFSGNYRASGFFCMLLHCHRLMALETWGQLQFRGSIALAHPAKAAGRPCL